MHRRDHLRLRITDMLKKTEFKKYAVLAARAADDKKAERIKLFFIGDDSALADFVLIASVDSPPQMEAVEDAISRKLKDAGFLKLHKDGTESAAWRVLDYGGFLVHLMTPELREFYGIDRIYHFGKETNWAAPKPGSKRKTVKK